MTGIFNKFLNDQSNYDYKVKKCDMKRSIEFKVLTHISKFTNDSVDKDFLMNSQSFINSGKGKLPKISSSTNNNNPRKFSTINPEKLFEARGKI